MGGSGWRADIEYDKMGVSSETSIDSPVAFRVFQVLMGFIMLAPIVFVVVTVLTK